jgi:hypothetical protein
MSAPDRSFPNGSPVCDYWLSRCEGFTVRAGHRTLGVVQAVDRDGRVGRTDRLLLHKPHRRTRPLPAGDVLAVVPARRELLVRRPHHAGPAMRRAYGTATPVVVKCARATAVTLAVFAHWIARTLRREIPRLREFLLAEIHDRNLNHGDEPGVGRTHRRANEYAFAAQQPLGRGRNVGPGRRPSARARAASRPR